MNAIYYLRKQKRIGLEKRHSYGQNPSDLGLDLSDGNLEFALLNLLA